MDLIDQIEQALGRPDKKKSTLAALLKRHPNTVTAILRRERTIKAEELPIIRKYLEIDTVPIVGIVGASSDQVFYGENADDPNETVPRPPESSPDTVAVEIRGDSLGPGLNGWLAFYDDQKSPVTPDLIGRLCVVAVDDGRILIKIPRTAKRGRYHLWPNVGNDVIPDAKLEWAARVTHMSPKPVK